MSTIASPLPDVLSAPGQSACAATKACMQESLAQTEDYVRQHPLPVLLGALTLGVALGCAMVVANRREASLRERILDKHVSKFRDALYEALEPVADHLKQDCASVQNCVERTFSGRRHSWSDQLGRLGRHLKFW